MSISMTVKPPTPDSEDDEFVLSLRIKRRAFYEAVRKLRTPSRGFAALLLDECEESGSRADKLLALETIVREIERREKPGEETTTEA